MYELPVITVAVACTFNNVHACICDLHGIKIIILVGILLLSDRNWGHIDCLRLYITVIVELVLVLVLLAESYMTHDGLTTLLKTFHTVLRGLLNKLYSLLAGRDRGRDRDRDCGNDTDSVTIWCKALVKKG